MQQMLSEVVGRLTREPPAFCAGASAGIMETMQTEGSSALHSHVARLQPDSEFQCYPQTPR